MKIIALTVLLYGQEHLEYAMRSVLPFVNEYWIIYSPIGSHGHKETTPCPEHPADLYELALRVAGDKLRWYTDLYPHEGAQRDAIFKLAPDADLVIVTDYDEVWQEGLVEQAITFGLEANVRSIRVPFRHYWRSFYRCVLNDAAFPVRIINPKVSDGEATLSTTLAVNHLGYAISSEMAAWKWQVHGHKNELRPSWYADRWLPNAQEDVHPTNVNYWNPVSVAPLEYMPAFMQEHPYYSLEVIP